MQAFNIAQKGTQGLWEINWYIQNEKYWDNGKKGGVTGFYSSCFSICKALFTQLDNWHFEFYGNKILEK